MSTPDPTNGVRTIVVRVEPRLQKILPNFLAKREEDLHSRAANSGVVNRSPFDKDKPPGKGVIPDSRGDCRV